MNKRAGYTLGNRKVAIIGAGFVGASIAYAMALRDIAREIVIVNRTKEKVVVEVMDIRHGIPSMGTTDVQKAILQFQRIMSLLELANPVSGTSRTTELELLSKSVRSATICFFCSKTFSLGILCFHLHTEL